MSISTTLPPAASPAVSSLETNFLESHIMAKLEECKKLTAGDPHADEEAKQIGHEIKKLVDRNLPPLSPDAMMKIRNSLLEHGDSSGSILTRFPVVCLEILISLLSVCQKESNKAHVANAEQTLTEDVDRATRHVLLVANREILKRLVVAGIAMYGACLGAVLGRFDNILINTVSGTCRLAVIVALTTPSKRIPANLAGVAAGVFGALNGLPTSAALGVGVLSAVAARLPVVQRSAIALYRLCTNIPEIVLNSGKAVSAGLDQAAGLVV